jgi:tetratricopeptide (TPR) repeat protein
MTPRGEAYDVLVREHLKLLSWSRKTPQKELAKALGDVYPCQVTRRMEGETAFKTRELSALLEAMGVDQKEFHAGISGGFHVEVYLARIASDNGRQKNYAASDLMAGSPSRPYTADELREVAAGLRDLRIANPEAARIQALDVLRTAFHGGIDPGPESRFEAAITLAAVYRTRGSSGTAAAFLLQTLHLAGHPGCRKARVLHETVPLAGDLGDLETGLLAAELSLAEFARYEDFQGQGRVLVSKGILLWHAGHVDEAIDAYSKALPVLTEDRWYQRFAALQGLGHCYLLKGESSKALHYADRAVAALEGADVPPLQEAEARWLRGDILLRLGSSEGVPELRAALDLRIRANGNKLDLALISLRLACIYHQHGCFEELGELTANLIPLLEKVAATNKLVQGALAEFNARLVRGELSRGVLRRAYRALVEADRKAPTAAHFLVD